MAANTAPLPVKSSEEVPATVVANLVPSVVPQGRPAGTARRDGPMRRHFTAHACRMAGAVPLDALIDFQSQYLLASGRHNKCRYSSNKI